MLLPVAANIGVRMATAGALSLNDAGATVSEIGSSIQGGAELAGKAIEASIAAAAAPSVETLKNVRARSCDKTFQALRMR